jgi:hypothetical protein
MKPHLLIILAASLGGFCGGAEPPQVFRNFMPEAGPSAFGVVLGPELALIYDPLRGGVNQVWRGKLDLEPTRRAKINEPAAVVGAVFYQEATVQPLRVGSADAVPVRRFKGYRYEADTVVFEFTLDGVPVRETLRSRADGAVERILSAPPGTVLFYLAEAQSGSQLTITRAEEIHPGTWQHEAVDGKPLTLIIQPLEKR